MVPYGRNKKFEEDKYCDVGDIINCARQSSIGQVPKPRGEYKSLTRNSKTKRQMRRIYKKAERFQSKRNIDFLLQE